MNFSHRGIFSKLKFIELNQNDFIMIIDYLFEKYNIYSPLKCEIIIHERDMPKFLGEIIALASDKSLVYYQQIDYQLAHELTHLIQFHFGLIKAERMAYDNIFEVEARKNAKYVIYDLLKYTNYSIKE